MSQVSAGVVVRELDFSLYAQQVSTTVTAILGTATKGDVNVPVLITSVPQLINTFGPPPLNDFGILSALQFLREGNQMFYVRVTNGQELSASATITDGETSDPGVKSSLVAQGITFQAQVAGVAGNSTSVTIIDPAANDIPLSVAVVGTDISVTLATGATGSITTTGAQLATAITNSVPASALITAVSTGVVALSALAKTNLSGGVAPVVEDEVLKITAATPGTWANGNKLGVELKSAYYTVDKFAVDSSLVTPSTGMKVFVNGTGLNAFLNKDFFVLEWSGSAWIGTETIESFITSAETGMSVTYNGVSTASTETRYNLDILGMNGGALAVVETYRNLSMSSADDRFIESVVNNGIAGEISASQNVVVDSISEVIVPKMGIYFTEGGNDGDTGLTPADYIGVSSGQISTGLQNFANAEVVDVNLLACPGVSDANVINELLSLAQRRHDCMAIIDSPFGLDVAGVVDWHNGKGYGHAAFNSSFGALYWSWIKTYDPYNKRELFLPPSGFVLGQIALTDRVAAPWFAPAGLNRGHILKGLTLEQSPDLGQREHMQGNQNAVNPIVNFTKDGINIWGQRTLQRKPSALDRVNVRRMLLYAEKVIASSVRYLVFEPNDERTWRQFEMLVNPVMEAIKTGRGVYDFKVQCDASTNSTLDIDQNRMNGKILLKPTKAAETITIDFIVLSTGAEFSDFT